jgi:hypothetical protein
MARPKSNRRFTTNKKTTGKASARKATTRAKKTTKAKPKAKAKTTTRATPKLILPNTKQLTTRRPPNNPDMPENLIKTLSHSLNSIKEVLEEYAQHLRSLDRRRLNGVGIKHQGFIDRTLELAVDNPEFFPHYLTLEKFQDDDQYLVSFRALYDSAKQIQEILWNITIISSDIVYTDALEYYASVREAAKRRVDAAETLYKVLEVFFKRRKPTGSDGLPIQTEKDQIHDAIAYIHGAKNGKFLAENISPKLKAGVHKVIDEKFTDSESFSEKADGEIRE